jgi:iron complex outermembrane receptor protein
MSRLFRAASAAAMLAASCTAAFGQTIDLPEVTVNPDQKAASDVPPIKEKFQLPQTSASVTAQQVEQTINIVDTEDAVKYLPSLFVRKRNYGDTQPVLATRTWGVNSSARSLVYADDLLLSALIANNNSIGAPRWGLVTPDEIERVDFLYGPFAAAYPGNSIGGVLLITTKMPEKFEASIKQTEALQTFSRYDTNGNYRTDQTNLSTGNKNENFSFLITGNYQNSYSQPLSWITTPGVPAKTTGLIPQLNKTGQVANVAGAGGLLHTEMTNLNGKFAWDITPWLQAKYMIGLWANDGDSSVQTYLRTLGGVPTFGGLSGFANSNYTINQQHLANAFTLKSDTGGLFDFDIALSRYDYLEDIQRSPYGVTSTGPFFTTNGKIARLDGTNWMNGDAKFIWRPNEAHEVSFGLHADRYYLNNPTYASTIWNSGPDATSKMYTDSIGATTTAALWGQDAWRFAPDFKLTLGGRLENWQATQGFNLATTANSAGTITRTTIQNQPEQDATRFSPKASLNWKPNEWQVTASFGQAYRFPTVTELYQIVQTGSVYAVPNPNLAPENALSEELAIERSFDGGKIRLSLFNEHVDDALIQQTAFLATYPVPVNYVTNVQAIRNTGIEIAASKKDVFIAGLEMFGSVTYVDSRILADPTWASATGTSVVGKHVPYVPDWRATIGATYTPDQYWAYTVAARYSGKQYSTLDNTDIIPNVYGAFNKFFVVDVKARYKFNEQASISLGIDNIGNESYTLFHPFPQRTFIADAKITF